MNECCVYFLKLRILTYETLTVVTYFPLSAETVVDLFFTGKCIYVCIKSILRYILKENVKASSIGPIDTITIKFNFR